jgi:hypothetical protein
MINNLSIREKAAFLLNNCCNGNAALSSACVVQLHDTVNSIKIMTVVKDTFTVNLFRRLQ